MTALAGMVFWGATGQALVLREALAGTGVPLLAVFDNDANAVATIKDVPVTVGWHGFEQWKAAAPPGPIGFLVAIGGHRGTVRLTLHAQLSAAGLQPMVAVHPTAWLAAGITPGPGSQILARTAVAAGASIGSQCIVNTSASVDHECVLADGTHIGPGAVLAGCVRVERGATVYTGATVAPRVVIGEGAIVGAGSVVLEDVPPFTVVAGNPARKIKEAHHV